MGKPGGFFKKLKAKQKKKATKQRRGTKGASKEERRLKYNDRVAFYTAKRQAEELAAVSSSSEDEPASDSDREDRREEKKLRKLQRMLGVEVNRRGKGRNTESELEDNVLKRGDAVDNDSVEESEGGSEKDWQYFLGDEEDEEAEIDGEEDGEEGEEEEDGDDLMMDLGSEEEEEDEGEAVENPLLELGSEDSLEDTDMAAYDAEDEEEEDEEEEREDEYVDEDEEDEPGLENTPRKLTKKQEKEEREKEKLRTRESKTLIPQFKLGTSSLSTIQNSTSLSEKDPWLLKYHLDEQDEVDKTPLESITLSAEARNALKHTNEDLKKRAEEVERATTRKERGVFFVSPEDYDRVHPEDVAVALSSHAKQNLLHPPFDWSTDSRPAKRPREEQPPTSPLESPPPYLHPALWERWVKYREKCNKPIFTVEERGLFDLLQGYPDLLDCMRQWQNAASRRDIFVLHLLNHWFKARSVVLAHDKIIEAHREQKKKKRSQSSKKGKKELSESTLNEEEEEDALDSEHFELRDRGFSKTRLFVMLPMRNIALLYIKTIIEVLGADPLQCNKLETLVGDFSEVEDIMDPTFKRRPLDYRRQFDGNIDDSFCVGLHLQPDKVSVYAHPLNSDIILCSPLGIRKRIEKNGDILVSLSSVEVCLIDEAHVLLMQNWDHPAAVLEMLNKRPTETTHGLSDLRRVYAWALNGKSGRHRQTIISSNISHATLLGAFRSSVNSSGKVLLQKTEREGVVTKVVGGLRQHFMRFEASSLESVDEERFKFFTESIFPTKINTLAEREVRIIIFVPSYFDFVRLRNYLYKEYRDSFAALSEYSSLPQQRQALGQFSDLERPILLVTERFYFFKRYFVKLAEVMVFYSPPLFAEYYSDLVNRLVLTSPNAFSLCIYCRYDTHELSRLVGTKRTRQLLERESGVFSFVTS